MIWFQFIFLGSAEEHTGLSRALSRLSELEEKVEHIHTEQVNILFWRFIFIFLSYLFKGLYFQSL